jgi:hypothetical protein
MLHVVEVEEAEAEEAEAEEAEAIAACPGRGSCNTSLRATLLVCSRYLKIFETRSNFRTLVLRNRS